MKRFIPPSGLRVKNKCQNSVSWLVEDVRMAEWSKALRSGRSPLLWARVRIPLLTKLLCLNHSRVAQWKRAGPITQRSVDRNYALLRKIFLLFEAHPVRWHRSKLSFSPSHKICPISAEDSALDF